MGEQVHLSLAAKLRPHHRDLRGMLRALGIEKAFLPGADFGNITEADAMASKVIQNTMLKLDPNGAEGAAYTIFAVAAGCAPEPMPEPVRVVFDRPFALPFSRIPVRRCLLGHTWVINRDVVFWRISRSLIR